MVESAAAWGQKELADLCLLASSAPSCARQTSSFDMLCWCLRHEKGEEQRGWGAARHRHPQGTPLLLPTPGWGLGGQLSPGPVPCRAPNGPLGALASLK